MNFRWHREARAEVDAAAAFYAQKQPGKVILHPANPAMRPLVYAPDQVRIQGVLVGLLRSYR